MGIDSRSGECANEWILARSTPYEGPLAEGASRTGTKAGPSHEQKPAASPDLSRLIDLKKVIAWVREHAHQYGANPTPLFVAGSSAGGHMAASAALTQGDPAFQPGFENADTSVREPPARG
ncbi:alpha/beta hydrolase fold domain-containing protein [Actinorugispora endophytica]